MYVGSRYARHIQINYNNQTSLQFTEHAYAVRHMEKCKLIGLCFLQIRLWLAVVVWSCDWFYQNSDQRSRQNELNLSSRIRFSCPKHSPTSSKTVSQRHRSENARSNGFDLESVSASEFSDYQHFYPFRYYLFVQIHTYTCALHRFQCKEVCDESQHRNLWIELTTYPSDQCVLYFSRSNDRNVIKYI